MGTVFSAYDIRGRLGETISVESVWTAGKAFAEWLPDEGSVVIVTASGADSSITHAFVEGLLLQGRNVIDAGEGDEQKVNSAIADHQAVGGAFISHDGVQNLEIIAFYDARGSLVGAENGLTAICELVESGNFLPAAVKGNLNTQ